MWQHQSTPKTRKGGAGNRKSMPLTQHHHAENAISRANPTCTLATAPLTIKASDWQQPERPSVGSNEGTSKQNIMLDLDANETYRFWDKWGNPNTSYMAILMHYCLLSWVCIKSSYLWGIHTRIFYEMASSLSPALQSPSWGRSMDGQDGHELRWWQNGDRDAGVTTTFSLLLCMFGMFHKCF